MTEPHEPSYYEIALTNRQVLVAFVILLLCVVAAFVGGVWLGRNGDGPGATATVAEAAEPGDLADLEEFKFFSEDGDGGADKADGGDDAGVDPPDLGRVRAEASPPPPPTPATEASPRTLAEDVGRRPPPPATPPSPPPPPAAVSPPRPPAASPPAMAGGFVIQVFSSRDRAQAEKVRADLAAGGHRAFLSPVEVGSATMYRVRIGPFGDRAEAERSARAINRKFKLDTWITSN